MPRPLPPPTDAQLMMLSAYLDGELTAAEEAQILDAMSQNPQLLDAFEALTAAHVGRVNALVAPTAEEADALVASIMAATAPPEMPATLDGALQLAQLAFDGIDFDRQSQAALDAALLKPGAAPAVSGFVASAEATQAAMRAVAAVPSVVESLRAVPDQVGARVAAAERFGMLASACLDDALTPNESAELDELLARGDPDEVPALLSALHASEALRVASTSTAFARLGAKAGEAALHVIEAERARAAQPAQPAQPARSVEPAPSLFARLGALFAATRAPLAFAGAAFALFFVVGRTGETTTTPSDDDVKRDILAAWVRTIDAGTDVASAYGTYGTDGTDLPLLADNSADVEAIDSAGTTVVFATESSNITVIWVDVEAEEGT